MTMLVIGYPSKKVLKEHVGKPLRYRETSLHGAEYTPNGSFVVAHRPAITGKLGREFFAKVTMRDGKISKVE